MPVHVPVLFAEVLSNLQLQSNDDVIDATLGGGGHAAAILEKIAPRGRLLGIEADSRTLAVTSQSLAKFGERFVGVNGNFRDLTTMATANNFSGVSAVLFDLGMSSIALDDSTRGFSFQNDGPLDMRFNPAQTVTAGQIVNHWPTDELIDIFRRYGEEPLARRIAERIVADRQRLEFTRTGQLVESIMAVKHRRGRIHPATQVFQALRMAVNDEPGALAAALPQAWTLLKTGGRLAVISFHSLEDRPVKRWMKEIAAQGQGQLINKHVLVATRSEQLTNPRSRSAKLRIIQKN